MIEERAILEGELVRVISLKTHREFSEKQANTNRASRLGTAVIRYEFGIVYIRFVGTHAEYDRIDAETHLTEAAQWLGVAPFDQSGARPTMGALKEIDRLIDAEPRPDRLKVLSLPVGYEQEHGLIDPLEPIDAVRFTSTSTA